MARRDQLTYDLGQDARPPVPWKAALLLACVIAMAVLLVVWTLTSNRTPQATQATQATQASASTSASPTASPSTPGASLLPSGSDAAEGLGVPEGSQQAASAFVKAWLDPNPKTRQPALSKVATPALGEQLMLTDPANIPKARPRGAPVLDDASTFSTQFTQALSTGMRISVYLVADPEAQYGWLATSVDQA